MWSLETLKLYVMQYEWYYLPRKIVPENVNRCCESIITNRGQRLFILIKGKQCKIEIGG